jgi:hypothetical protein
VGAYKQHGLKARLEVVYGGAHGGPGFFDAPRQELVKSFLGRHLKRLD